MVRRGAPAWMVSFGDMMTLILTFFILLVSMGDTQQIGLVASGVGSFLIAVRSFGLPGVLDDNERAQMFDNVRERFNLPPETEPERRENHLDAASLELIRARSARALQPHRQVAQPAIAVFRADSAELDADGERYISLLAPTLVPAPGQALLLEGHALDAGENFDGDDHALAFARALAVRDYLVTEHGFPPMRVEARAWVREIDPKGAATRSVDARLIIPTGN